MIASSKGEDPVWHELLDGAIVSGYLDTLEETGALWISRCRAVTHRNMEGINSGTRWHKKTLATSP